MKKLYDEVRGRIIGKMLRVVSPDITIGDLEIVITEIERILIEEKILR